ncbi:FitA-like ribbon-helix-helix domain-containing protein [Scytonema sp. NUACC26]|uniref:FitA-like ribbon-helix-helix domain-containing protein n=1 Tax=Scytonema sp. NUACC26 TaxID=3140176 RepID=UPI0034DCADAF
MIQLVITDLEPTVIEKLKARATCKGRTLEAELKAILTEAAEIAPKNRNFAELRQIFEEGRQRYGERQLSDSTELLREDRQR